MEGLGDGRLDKLIALLGELPKGFTVALACPREARRTVWPSAGTSKGWNTQAITLGLSFRLPVTHASESQGLVGLFGPQFRWKRSLKHHFLVASFGFELARAMLAIPGSCGRHCLFTPSPAQARLLAAKEPRAPAAETENPASSARGAHGLGEG